MLETATARGRSLSNQPRRERKPFTGGESSASARFAAPIKNVFFKLKRAPAEQHVFHNSINQLLKRRAAAAAAPGPALAGGERSRYSIRQTDVNNQPLPP